MAVRCPSCNCGHCPAVKTMESIVRFRGRRKKMVRRRRVCRHCEHAFYSREFIEDDDELPPLPPTELGPMPDNPFI
jgi:transcriptional regulator NrdR family protein